MKTIESDLKKLANKNKAQILQRFFKTGKGEYGEGDIFLGLTSQQIKDVAKQYSHLELKDIQKLLKSKIHEERTCALRILIRKYEKSDDKQRKIIFHFYLKNASRINNWDLVDISSPNIIGNYLLNKKDRTVLYKLARGKNLWEKRIAIVSTYAFIREKQFDDTLKISKILLKDSHDLIHKAVGWMLREVGKRDENTLRVFLRKNYDELPRTTLRYAIEKFEEGERKKWLMKKT